MDPSDLDELCPTTTFTEVEENAKMDVKATQSKFGVHGKHGKTLEAKMRKKKKGKRWKNRWVVLQGGSMVHDSSPTITYCDWNKNPEKRKWKGVLKLKDCTILGPPSEADGKPCFTLVAAEYTKLGEDGEDGPTKPGEFYFQCETWVEVTDWVRAIMAFQKGIPTMEPEPETVGVAGHLIIRNLSTTVAQAAVYINDHGDEASVVLKVSSVCEVGAETSFNLPIDLPDSFGTPFVVVATDAAELGATMSIDDFLASIHFDASFSCGEDDYDDIILLEVEGALTAQDPLTFVEDFPDLAEKVKVRATTATEASGESSFYPASAIFNKLKKSSPNGFWFSPYDFSQSMRYMSMKKASGENSEPNYAFVPGPTAQRWAEPEPEAEPIRIVLLGDLMPMNGELSPSADKSIVDMISRADIVFANIEAPVCHVEKIASMDMLAGGGTSCSFNIALDFVRDSLKNVGASPEKTVCTLANNHAGDMGLNGLGIEITRKNLNSIGCVVVGLAGVGPLPGMLTKMNVRDTVVGIVAWTRWMNNNVDLKDLPVWRQEDVMDVDWAAVKKAEKVDCLIGYPHWGFEQSYTPDKADTDLAAKLLDTGGFDAIVGHGPHVLQSVEVRTGKDDGRPKMCCYSGGNLCSMRGKWQTKLAAVVELEIRPKVGCLDAYKCLPYVQRQAGGLIPTHLIPLDQVPCVHDIDFLTDPKANEEDVCALFGAPLSTYEGRMDKLFYENKRRKGSEAGYYKVTVFTARDRGSGTDEYIFATLIGSKGEGTETRLMRPGIDCFEAHSRDQFFIKETEDIGELQSVRLRMVNRKLSKFDRFRAHGSWQVNRLVCLRLADNKKSVFIINKWLEADGEESAVLTTDGPVTEYWGRSKVDGMLSTLKPSITELTLQKFLEIPAEELHTGDIIMFSARSFMSIFTKYFTGSVYSHAAVIVKHEDGTPFLFESTKNGDKTPDVAFSFDYCGMHAFNLDERLSSASGDLIWFRLKEPMAPDKEADVRAFARECHRKRIGYAKWKVFVCGMTHIGMMDGNEEEEFNEELGIQEDNDPEMFCSEFAMKCLKIGGVAGDDSNAAESTPLAVTLLPIWQMDPSEISNPEQKPDQCGTIIKGLPADLDAAKVENAYWD